MCLILGKFGPGAGSFSLLLISHFVLRCIKVPGIPGLSFDGPDVANSVVVDLVVDFRLFHFASGLL